MRDQRGMFDLDALLNKLRKSPDEASDAVGDVTQRVSQYVPVSGSVDPRRVVSETEGAVTNLGTRTAAQNSELYEKLTAGEGMSGVFDHSSGKLILRRSSDILDPLPVGWVRQTGGHRSVRADLGEAIGEDLSNTAKGRLSGFAIVKQADGTPSFKWNSGQINPASHGSRTVPEALRPAIEAAVKAALGL